VRLFKHERIPSAAPSPLHDPVGFTGLSRMAPDGAKL
jgi:hypothetical protein